MSKYDASVEKEKAAKAKGKDNGINAISNTEPEQSVRGWEQGRMCVFGEKGGERGLMFVETLLNHCQYSNPTLHITPPANALLLIHTPVRGDQ